MFAFQSTPSVGRATIPPIQTIYIRLFQSTPSVGRATKNNIKLWRIIINFNPRPPWGGRRSYSDSRANPYYFNPRPPWGGRHRRRIICFIITRYFNPRPPWGGRRGQRQTTERHSGISIHALRGEGDESKSDKTDTKRISIHALRGEGDIRCRLISKIKSISIHALRGEGDVQSLTTWSFTPHFNPRPPWGGRLQKYTNMQCYACT